MANKLVSDLERIASKVEYIEDTGCWQWRARLDKDGYGAQVKVGSRSDGTRHQQRPHRWMFTQLIDPIPEGLVIDHLCRNRACVNPFHMEPVTPLENHHRGLRAQRAVCPKGHPIAGENARRGNHGLICRKCANAYQNAYNRANGWAYSKAYRERKRGEKSVLATV